MRTISKAIDELKNNLKNSAKIITTDFYKKCQEVADNISERIDKLQEHAKDTKDRSVASIQEEYNVLKEHMKKLQKATDDKTNEYQKIMVKKLEELSKKIEEYNNKHKN